MKQEKHTKQSYVFKLVGKLEKHKMNYRKQVVLANRVGAVFVLILTILAVISVNMIRLMLSGGDVTIRECIRQSRELFFFIPLFVISLLVAGRQSARFTEALCEGLEEAAKGNLDYRLDEKGAGPYKRAYKNFNNMCENLSSTEESLKRAVMLANQSNEAKSNFLSNMSHEIRTPINAVMGFDEMIIRESNEPNIRDYAVDIKRAGSTLLGIISDILDASKIESGELTIAPTEYDLSSVIVDLVNMYQQAAIEKGLSFYLNIDERIPHRLFGDDIRIKQIVMNLLSNAVKYTDNGSVTLSMDYENIGSNTISLNVTVYDTGQGMKEEDYDALFGQFERIDINKNRTTSGAGLGMSLCKQLLSMMDSELKVESKYGKGSAFSFSIVQQVLDGEPIGNVEETFAKVREAESMYHENFHAPGARILIVDDAPVNLTVVEGLLKETQVHLDTAESGPEAIELCKKNKYHVAFIDHMMPGMDGVETMKHIKYDEDSLNRKIPIIVLTANAVAGAKEAYLSSGFTDYLSKPVEPLKLERMIVRYIPHDLIIVPDEGGTYKAPERINIDSITSTASEETISEPVIEIDENEVIEEKIKKLGEILDVNTEVGISFSGSPKLYISVVEKFVESGLSRADIIEQYYEQGDIENYTIQVHALKSSARVVGDDKLSKLAEKLEMAGKSGDRNTIDENNATLIKMYRELVESMTLVVASSDSLEEIDKASLRDAIEGLVVTVEAFDFDGADSIMEQLKKYKMPEDFETTYAKLKILMAEVSRDEILMILRDYKI